MRRPRRCSGDWAHAGQVGRSNSFIVPDVRPTTKGLTSASATDRWSRSPADAGVDPTGEVEGGHVVPAVTGVGQVCRVPAVAPVRAVPGGFPVEDADRAGISGGVLDIVELGG